MVKNANKKRLNRLLALMLTVFLLAAQGSALAVVNDKPENMAAVPDITVVATGTDNGAFVELGFNIQSAAESFKASAIVLKYNANFISPVEWEESAVETPVPEVVDTNTNPWDKAANLKTVSTTDFSVREARSFVLKTGGERTGYLSLNAMSPKAGVLNQALPQQAVDGKVQTEPLTATANGMKQLPVTDKQKVATPQAAVVRFKVKIDAATTKPYTLEEIFASIDIVKDEATPAYGIAENSVIKDASGVWYLASDKTVEELSKSTPVDVYMATVPQGVTANSGGGADPSAFASVVFYDWDETLLGSIIVPKGEDATELVKDFALSKMSPNSRDYTIANGEEDAAKPFFVDNKDYPLTYKKGYSFLTWIPYESAEPTSYGDRVTSNNMNAMATGKKPGAVDEKLIKPTVEADFSNLQSSINVKATFTTNSECKIGSEEADRRYDVSAIDFGRYGATSNFTITLQVKRNDVPRVTNPILRVKMSIGSTTVMSLYPLKGSDVETVQIIPYTTNTGGVDKIVWSIVDEYGLSNIDVAAQRTNEASTLSQRGVVSNLVFDGSSRAVILDAPNAYMHKCIVGGINIALKEYSPGEPYSTIGSINNAIMRSIGVGIGTNSTNQVKEKLWLKWEKINVIDGVVNGNIIPLTRQDMIDALGTAGQSPVFP